MVFWDEGLAAEYESMAKQYIPDDGVEVLLIGESPPETGENVKPYFYNTEATQGARLSDQIKSVMSIETSSKEEFLQKFEDKGLFLVDIFPTYESLQAFEEADSPAEKGRMKADLLKRLTEKITDFDPEKVVFIHKGSAKELALPFPAYGNQENFREELEEIMK